MNLKEFLEESEVINELFGFGGDKDDRDFNRAKQSLERIGLRNADKPMPSVTGQKTTVGTMMSYMAKELDRTKGFVKYGWLGSTTPQNAGPNPFTNQPAPKPQPAAPKPQATPTPAPQPATAPKPQAAQVPQGKPDVVNLNYGKIARFLNHISFKRKPGTHDRVQMNAEKLLQALQSYSRSPQTKFMPWDRFEQLAAQSGIDPMKLYQKIAA
jgi:hypothetical protein